MNFFKTHADFFNVFNRVLIALLGGYLLANLMAIFISTFSTLILPTDNRVNSIVTGLMSSFIVYGIAIIFVFSTKTVLRAFFTVFSACIVIFSLISYLNMVVKV
jgi:hypothetical protein